MVLEDALVHVVGWRGALLHGDPAMYDRYRWLRRQLAPGRVRTLDAGSGTGALSFYARNIGNETLALSFAPRNNVVAARRAKIAGLEGIEFRDGDLRELDRFGDDLGMFDQIICFETIEHIIDEQKLVRDLAARLRPGGRLIMTTPYLHYRRLRGDRLSDAEDGGHVRWGSTHERMQEMFAAAGVELIVADYVTGFISQKINNLARRLTERTDHRVGWVLTFPLRPFLLFDRAITRLLRYPSLSIALVGVRRADLAHA